MKPALLLVEDDEVFARAIARALEQRGYAVNHTLSADAAARAIAEGNFDYAILDLNLGGHTSLSLIQPLRKANPEMRILMLTGYASIATAVEAIKLVPMITSPNLRIPATFSMPCSQKTMRRSLRKWRRRNQLLSPCRLDGSNGSIFRKY